MKILVVDDHQIILDGLASIFDQLPDVDVVGYLDNATDALKYIKNLNIDVLLTDIEMPDKNGIWLIKEVKKNYPDVNILVLSMHNNAAYIHELYKLGIDGYLLKTTTKEELKASLENVVKGKKQFSSEITEEILNINRKVNHHEFSKRELEVLDLLAEGLSTKEIAERLYLSSKTIEKHRASLMFKADVKNVAGLISYGFKNSLIQ